MAFSLGLPRESVYVHLSDHFLKIIKVQEQAKTRTVTGCYAKSVAGMETAELAQEVLNAKKALSLKSVRTHVVLPSDLVITKSIEVPSMDKAEIEKIILLQASRHTPYNREEILSSYIELEVILSRYTKALLVIASESKVRRITNILEAAGCQIESVAVGMEALALGAVKLLSLGEDHENLGIIHLDSMSTDCVIVRKQKPFFIRNIPMGFQQMHEGSADVPAQFAKEIKETCQSFEEGESGQMPKRFVIMGLESRWMGKISEAIHANIGAECSPFFAKDQLKINPTASDQLEKYKEMSFADLLMAGGVVSSTSLNLLPGDLKIRSAFREKGREMYRFGVFAMIIFILSLGIFLTKIYYRSAYLESLETQMEANKSEIDELIRLSDQNRIVRELKRQKGKVLTVLAELQRILPGEIYISELKLSREGEISMKGTSDFMSMIFTFVTEFENNQYFQEVKTDFTQSRKEKGKDVADFGISAKLENL